MEYHFIFSHFRYLNKLGLSSNRAARVPMLTKESGTKRAKPYRFHLLLLPIGRPAPFSGWRGPLGRVVASVDLQNAADGALADPQPLANGSTPKVGFSSMQCQHSSPVGKPGCSRGGTRHFLAVEGT